MELIKQLIITGLTTLSMGVLSVWCFMRGETINGAIGAFLFLASAGAFLHITYKLVRKRK
jgi:nicotinamide riboside transporter PnuC